MDHVGNIALKGGGQLKTLRVENLVADPVSPFIGQMWANTVENSFKGFNGVEVVTFATGGNTALLIAEIDAIEAAIGLAADGTFVAPPATNYLTAATDIVGLSVLLDTQLKAVNDAVTAEATARANADTSIRTDFAAADTALQGSINLANAARITADNAIRADFAAADVALQDAITAEETARIAEDTDIRTDFAAADAAIASDLTDEVTARTAADTAIRTDFAAADVVVQASVTAEETARIAADTAIRTDFAAADAVVQASVAAEETARIAADATKVSKAGDSMSGNLAFGSAGTVTGLTEPVNSSDAATKNYVDNVVVGLSWKDPVNEVSADHTGIATGALAVGYRVIDTSDDSIYTWSGSVWTAYVPVDGDSVFDSSDETGYVFNGTNWVQFTGGSQIVAGVGLAKDGNRLDINLGAGITQLPTDEVGIDLYATGGLMLTVDGSTSSTSNAAQIGIKLDGTSLNLSGSGLSLSTALQTAISSATSGLAQEITDRTAADAAIASDLADAVAARVAEDAAIRADFAAADAAIASDLTDEVTARTAADTSIRTDFAAADAAIQNDLDIAEAAIATASGLISALQADLAQEVTDRAAADTAVRTDFAAADTAIQTEVDAIETAVGLAAGGTLAAFSATNYLNAAATIKAALVALDTATKAVSDAVTGASYLYTGAVAQTDHVVSHSLGKQFVQVMVIDSSNQKIQPDAIKFDSANQLTVSFISAITCKVYVTR